MNILAELQRRVAAVISDWTPDPAAFAAMVRPAQDARFGDFQANTAMPLGRQLGRSPRELAAAIVERLSVADLCLPPEIAGPGFINFTLRTELLEAAAARVFADPRLGVDPVEAPRTIIVDFSSPNVAKPMHVGHVRSTVIGDCLQRLLRFLGHRVISDNHVGDWGAQFGMILYGYKHFLDREAYAREAVAELARLYRLVNTLCDHEEARQQLPTLEAAVQQREEKVAALEGAAAQDKSLQQQLKRSRSDLEAARDELRGALKTIAAVAEDPAMQRLADLHPGIVRATRDETASLHAGDAVNRTLWGEFVPACMAALHRVYDVLNVQFDYELGESYYDPFLPGVVESLKERGLAVESEGAVCVFLEGRPAPFIVRKADGAFTYATTDLATIEYRVREFGAQTILYVVDARQSDHFQMLFETARRWGYEQLDLRHVSFGTVMGDDGKPFKTRAGGTVGLESVLDQAVVEAHKVLEAPGEAPPDEAGGAPPTELDAAARTRVAQVVGLGGVKYADLHHNRESDYIFNLSKMLAKTGDTATYMQYAYARTRGILRKSGLTDETLAAAEAPIRLQAPSERRLGLRLCRFEEALLAAAQEHRPNLLAQYLFELANEFSTFYDECAVLKEQDAAIRLSRLKLTQLTGRMIRQGLELLGIDVCERM